MPRRSLLLLLALLLISSAAFVAASDWLTLDWLKTHRDDLIAFCEQNMALMIAAYVLTFTVCAALSLPGAALFTMAAGMVFGHVLGVVLATFSAVVGATLAFLIARHLLAAWAHARFRSAFERIDAGIRRDGALYLFMLRLIVVVPFFVVNPVMGLTAMPVRTFVVASTLGMLVNTFVWVNAGTMLAQIDDLGDVFSWQVVAALALIGVLPLVLKWLFYRGK